MKAQTTWKKWIQTGCVMAVIALVAAPLEMFAHVKVSMQYQIEDQDLPVMRWTDSSQEDMEAFSRGQVVMEWNEGEVIPCFMDIEGDFFKPLAAEGEEDEDQKQPTLSIQTMGHCYVKCVGGGFMFSDDLHKWCTFEEFFTGTFGYAFTAQHEIHVTAKLYRRV